MQNILIINNYSNFPATFVLSSIRIYFYSFPDELRHR